MKSLYSTAIIGLCLLLLLARFSVCDEWCSAEISVAANGVNYLQDELGGSIDDTQDFRLPNWLRIETYVNRIRGVQPVRRRQGDSTGKTTVTARVPTASGEAQL